MERVKCSSSSLSILFSLFSLLRPPNFDQRMTEVAAGLFDGFMHGEKKGEHCSGFRFVNERGGDESSEISSIGAESLSAAEDDRGEDDEVQSKPADGPLGSLESLEESLPIKRGLSYFFPGKSKSFVCLSEIGSSSVVGELAKLENPLNKRRRILNAHKPSPWMRRASCGSLLLPPLTVVEAKEDEENDDDVAAVGSDLLPPLPRNIPNG